MLVTGVLRSCQKQTNTNRERGWELQNLVYFIYGCPLTGRQSAGGIHLCLAAAMRSSCCICHFRTDNDDDRDHREGG